jgi:hypothetical protein
MSNATVNYIDDARWNTLTDRDRKIYWEEIAVQTIPYERPDRVSHDDWITLKTDMQTLAPPGWHVEKIVGNPWNPDASSNNSCKVLNSANEYNMVFHTQRHLPTGRQHMPRSRQRLLVFVSRPPVEELTHETSESPLGAPLQALLSRLERFTY